jgi:hypothetical protein
MLKQEWEGDIRQKELESKVSMEAVLQLTNEMELYYGSAGICLIESFSSKLTNHR